MWVYEWTRLGETNNSKREFKMRSVRVWSVCVCVLYTGEEETYVYGVCSMFYEWNTYTGTFVVVDVVLNEQLTCSSSKHVV